MQMFWRRKSLKFLVILVVIFLQSKLKPAIELAKKFNSNCQIHKKERLLDKFEPTLLEGGVQSLCIVMAARKIVMATRKMNAPLVLSGGEDFENWL